MAAPLTMALAVGLILIPVIVLVLVLPTWAERTSDARNAARNAARSLVTATDWQTGVTAADQTVQEIATNNGLPLSDITWTPSCTGSPCLSRGGTVTATVTVTIPATQFPGIGAFGTVHFTASSTERVDQYRPLPAAGAGGT
jgi:hypothetical protein